LQARAGVLSEMKEYRALGEHPRVITYCRQKGAKEIDFENICNLALLPTTVLDKDGDHACCQTFETRLRHWVKDNNQSLRNHST